MKPLVAIYYRQEDWESMKDLAARARNDGAEVRLVWAKQWQGAKSMLPGASAVIVQRECPNAKDIATCYVSLGNNVELHYVDYEGEFVDDDSKQAPPAPDPIVSKETRTSVEGEVTTEIPELGAYYGASEAPSEPTPKPASSRKKRSSRKSVQEESSDDGGSDGEDTGAE